MQARRHLRHFSGALSKRAPGLLLASLAALLLLPLLHQQFTGTGSQEISCEQANIRPCADYLRAAVKYYRHSSRSSLAEVCGNNRSNACALRRVRWGKTECDIHIADTTPDSVIEHELNHCRGWDHQADSVVAYNQPWHLNTALVQRAGYSKLDDG